MVTLKPTNDPLSPNKHKLGSPLYKKTKLSLPSNAFYVKKEGLTFYIYFINFNITLTALSYKPILSAYNKIINRKKTDLTIVKKK